MNTLKRLLTISIACSLMHGVSLFAMNLLRPFDTLIRPPYDRHLRYHTNIFLETSFGFKSFNSHNAVCSPLHIWQTEQDGLAMLKGFSLNSPINALSNQLNANDDGIRGNFKVCGDLSLPITGALDARFFFLHNWFISMELPVYHMKLHGLQFIDQTEDIVDADYRVKTLLTDDFAANVYKLGCIRLQDWQRTGIGDFTVLINWYRNFPQAKTVLKNARINWRVGLSLPTSKHADLDLVFALPFGYNGAVALPFGLGLDIMLGRYMQAGVDVQLTHIFGHSQEMRIKTEVNQTELLLLQKTKAYRDYGLIQRFNLYVQANRFAKGLSFLLGYQFIKHGADQLALADNRFSNTIANTAVSLQDWTSHQIITNLSYDFAVHTWNKSRVQPYASIYTRIPFNGKRFTGSRSIGFVVALDF